MLKLFIVDMSIVKNISPKVMKILNSKVEAKESMKSKDSSSKGYSILDPEWGRNGKKNMGEGSVTKIKHCRGGRAKKI